MGKSMKLLLFAGILLLFFSISISPSSGVSYNEDSIGLGLKCDPQVDTYTSINKQVCTFEITRIQRYQDYGSVQYSDEAYNDGDMPEEWGCMEYSAEVGGFTQKEYYSNVVALNDSISWNAMGAVLYSPHSKNSTKSIQIVHESLSSEYRGPEHVPRIDRNIVESTIGVVSFDVMAFLNISDEAHGYEPYAKLHFELDDQEDSASTIHLVFQTEYAGANNYSIAVYYLAINSTSGVKEIPVKVFDGALGIFNWMHVDLFYDLYNDVYNLTIAQYNMEFTDWLVPPTSVVIRGEQHTEDYKLSNVGFRYAPSHLINSLDFWIETKQNVPEDGWRSVAYIDNVEMQYWAFPAVYANVRLENATTQTLYEKGISYMNNSIISCYEPPRYPKATDNIAFTREYLLNAYNPGLLTPWSLAPQWQYYVPIMVSQDQVLNVKSLLNIINNVEDPLEEQGVMDPSLDSLYSNHEGISFADRYFEFVTSESYSYHYVFKSRYYDEYLVIDYYSDIAREGLLKQIALYNNSLSELPMVLFKALSEGQEYAEQRAIDGFPIGGVSLFSLIGIAYVLITRRK